MIIKCPQCAKSMEVPDDAEGKQTACPSCQHTFVIAAPGASASVEAKAAPPPAPEPRFQEAPPAQAPAQQTGNELPTAQPVASKSGGGFKPLLGRRSIREMGIWRYVASTGVALAIAAFFIPWFHAEAWLDGPKLISDRDRILQLQWQNPQEARQIAEEINRAAKEVDKVGDEGDFLEDRLSEKKKKELGKFEDEQAISQKKIDFEATLFGWDFWHGILTMIFALVAAGLVLVPMYVGRLQKTAWAFAFPAAGLGIASVIFCIVFLASAPSTEITSPYLYVSQTKREGCILALAGSIVWAVFAAVDGVMSLAGKTGQRAR